MGTVPGVMGLPCSAVQALWHVLAGSSCWGSDHTPSSQRRHLHSRTHACTHFWHLAGPQAGQAVCEPAHNRLQRGGRHHWRAGGSLA